MPIRPRVPIRAKRDGLWKHWTLWVWFALTAFLTLGAVVLWKSGHWLVKDSHFEKTPWAIVLAGETRDCERTDEVIRLFKAGRVDTIVLSACRIFKTRYQSEFMLDYMVAEGVPKGNIFEFRQDAYSTIEEARLLIRQFRFQNLDTVVIITSNYHTARTHHIFKKLSQGYPHILVHPAEFHTFNPASWWATRESRKYWLDEWLKTIFTFYEVWRSGPEMGKADYQNLLPDPGTSFIGIPDNLSSPTSADTLITVDSSGVLELSETPKDSADTTRGALPIATVDSSQDSSRKSQDSAPKSQDSAEKNNDVENTVKAAAKTEEKGSQSKVQPKAPSKVQPKPASKAQVKAQPKVESKAASKAQVKTPTESKIKSAPTKPVKKTEKK